MYQRRTVVAGLVTAIILCACAAQRPVETIRDSGDLHFKRGEYAAAAAEYQEITARYPGDFPAQHMLGQSLMEIGELTAARQALEVAHDGRPGDVAIADALAEVMYRQEDETQLYAFLRDRAESTRTVHAFLRLGKYCLLMRDPDSAKVALDTAIELDGGQSVTPYLAAANLAEKLGDVDEAIRRLRQAYGISPRDRRVTDALRRLGEIPGPTLALPPGR